MIDYNIFVISIEMLKKKKIILSDKFYLIECICWYINSAQNRSVVRERL